MSHAQDAWHQQHASAPCALLAQAGAGAQATQAQARSQRLCKL